MPSRPFVFEKMHQVYHVLDGAILVIPEGQAPGDLVRVGETVFTPAGQEVSLSFAAKYVRHWSFTSEDDLQTLLAGAGDAFESSVAPNQVALFDVNRVNLVAESLRIKIKL